MKKSATYKTEQNTFSGHPAEPQPIENVRNLSKWEPKTVAGSRIYSPKSKLLCYAFFKLGLLVLLNQISKTHLASIKVCKKLKQFDSMKLFHWWNGTKEAINRLILFYFLCSDFSATAEEKHPRTCHLRDTELKFCQQNASYHCYSATFHCFCHKLSFFPSHTSTMICSQTFGWSIC